VRDRIERLEGESADPDLWNDRERAERVLREKRSAERDLERYDALSSKIDDAEVLLELPGRTARWYVFPRMTCAPSATSSSGDTVFTDPCVPTGMNTGVSITPCGVTSRPRRASE
jgi:hypothetical protein